MGAQLRMLAGAGAPGSRPAGGAQVLAGRLQGERQGRWKTKRQLSCLHSEPLTFRGGHPWAAGWRLPAELGGHVLGMELLQAQQQGLQVLPGCRREADDARAQARPQMGQSRSGLRDVDLIRHDHMRSLG